MTRLLPHPAYLAIGRVSRTRLVRRFHPVLYHRFRGATVLGHILGCRTIVLHTTGARTGQPRMAALFAFRVPDSPDPPNAPDLPSTPDPPDLPDFTTARDGPAAFRHPVLAVVASNGGAGQPPAWYRNLEAHHEAVVEDGGDRWAARARVAEGVERERLWGVVTAAYPGYDDYQARTPSLIPVVVLEPVPGD